MIGRALTDDGLPTGEKKFQELLATRGTEPVFDEKDFNAIGYELLQEGKVEAAVYMWRRAPSFTPTPRTAMISWRGAGAGWPEGEGDLELPKVHRVEPSLPQRPDDAGKTGGGLVRRTGGSRTGADVRPPGRRPDGIPGRGRGDMKSMLETYLTLDQTKLLSATLQAQTRASGFAELPTVVGILNERECRDVLDVGTGEGSFLIEVARKAEAARFLGIDHNAFAIEQATAKLRRRALRNIRFETAFFDPTFDRTRHDAILTRYTLQHSSRPEDFVRAVFARLKRRGTFIAVESMESCTDCHVPDPVWGAYRAALLAVHAKIGSDGNVGRALGSLFRRSGFRNVQVGIVICSPSTVGLDRFTSVVLATTALAHTLFPDLFDRKLVRRMNRWLEDGTGIVRRDPYIATAIARGMKP
jgi:ubiquinone/menaquinone biosynthesis C-methylase UbiE